MHQLRSFLVIALALSSTLVACSDELGNDDLERADVDNLPAGDATGTAASGQWQATIRSTSCIGTCRVTADDGDVSSLCDVDDDVNAQFEVTQTNGRLEVETATLMRGGVDANGEFLVGGYSTQGGGVVELIGRMTGTINGDDMLGDVVVRVRGTMLDQAVDCTAIGEINATKL